MDVQWHKQGLIYRPSGDGFFKTHATRPIVQQIDDRSLRLFFASRDADDRMLPTFIDVDGDNPSTVISINDRPLIGFGSPGTFDDSGVTLGSTLVTGGERYFYYTGWKRRRVVSFELSIGMLRWDTSSQSLQRLSQGPLIGQDRHHPFLTAGPFVANDGGLFKMWYCSGTGWKFPAGNPEPIYTVFYAESTDGLTWNPHPDPVIPCSFDGEVISAPWVIKTNQGYRMWYSHRGHASQAEKQYRIGYAESPDGIAWIRRDDSVGITVATEGWDSEMTCYAAVCNFGDKTYMFYSGNGVGRGGIGYAVADQQLEILEW